MELVIPSLFALLIGALIAFYALPQLAAPILIGASVVTLLIAEWVHWNQFRSSEYNASTWQYNMLQYRGYIMFAAILLGAYGFYAMNSAPAAAPALPEMPPLTAPVIGGGFPAMMKTASSRMKELMRHGRITLE